MTVETVYFFLEEEDFELEESEDDHYHSAAYDVPEIIQAAWEGCMVIVHRCRQRGEIAALESAILGIAREIDTEANLLMCSPMEAPSPSDMTKKCIATIGAICLLAATNAVAQHYTGEWEIDGYVDGWGDRNGENFVFQGSSVAGLSR